MTKPQTTIDDLETALHQIMEELKIQPPAYLITNRHETEVGPAVSLSLPNNFVTPIACLKGDKCPLEELFFMIIFPAYPGQLEEEKNRGRIEYPFELIEQVRSSGREPSYGKDVLPTDLKLGSGEVKPATGTAAMLSFSQLKELLGDIMSFVRFEPRECYIVSNAVLSLSQ